jgi:hypothetical protein
MEHVIRQVFTAPAFAAKAVAVNNVLKCIARRALAATTLLACIYGLLAAEVELAKLEGFPAAIVR